MSKQIGLYQNRVKTSDQKRGLYHRRVKNSERIDRFLSQKRKHTGTSRWGFIIEEYKQ